MRSRNARATIREVASVAGVSTQTVSRVINERPDVSPETRKRVKEVIEKLSYQPSALARSLISQRSYTLGVVTAGLKFIGPSRTLSGITAAAEEAGYALLLKELATFEMEEVIPIFQRLLSRHVDGIIWAVPEIGNNHNWISSASNAVKVPLIFLTMQPRDNISVVSIDNYLGGRLAVAHLLEQGYRHIGHISGPLIWWEARQRMAGWKDTLQEAGIPFNDCHFAEGNWSSSSGLDAIEQLFHQYPEMDAVFAANDQMALSAIRFFREKGLRIPEDIGIIGFDNLTEAAYFYPPLSTIQQDLYQIGKITVVELTKIIEAGWEGGETIQPRAIVVPPTLIVRQSTMK